MFSRSTLEYSWKTIASFLHSGIFWEILNFRDLDAPPMTNQNLFLKKGDAANLQ